jgi:hypothetical protein
MFLVVFGLSLLVQSHAAYTRATKIGECRTLTVQVPFAFVS